MSEKLILEHKKDEEDNLCSANEDEVVTVENLESKVSPLRMLQCEDRKSPPKENEDTAVEALISTDIDDSLRAVDTPDNFNTQFTPQSTTLDNFRNFNSFLKKLPSESPDVDFDDEVRNEAEVTFQLLSQLYAGRRGLNGTDKLELDGQFRSQCTILDSFRNVNSYLQKLASDSPLADLEDEVNKEADITFKSLIKLFARRIRRRKSDTKSE